MKMGLSFAHSWGTAPLGQPWQSIGLAIVGIILGTIAIYSYWTTKSFIKTSEETQGTVIELAKRQNNASYFPVISYYVADSGEYILHSSTGSSPPRFSVNEQVTILYSPDKPSKARIKEFWSLWFVTVLAGALGFAFLLTAFLAWVYRRKLYKLAGYAELAGTENSHHPTRNSMHR